MYVELYKIIEIECLVVLILFLFVSLHYVSFFTIFIALESYVLEAICGSEY